ncbi:hypothetical protein Q9L58_010470 [Maublancomyces gigas]|uniref:Uncharacterized protein n=1 Tax=Discina gigas TaxID=1032678 RepID=A0ABR3G3Z9_9PEZI
MNDALGLPLLISRIAGLKAAARFPLFPNFEGGDPDDRGVPAFTDNTFVKWLSHHEQPASDYKAFLEDSRYDSGEAKPHIMRWFELTPLSITHGSHVDDSDTVVLSEAGQRMPEKQQLGVEQGIDLSELN